MSPAAASPSPILHSQAEYNSDDNSNLGPLFSDPSYELDDISCLDLSFPIAHPLPTSPPAVNSEASIDTPCKPDDHHLRPLFSDPLYELDDSSCTRLPPPIAPLMSTSSPANKLETPVDTAAENVDDKLPTPSSPAADSPPQLHFPEVVEAAKYLLHIGYFVHLPVCVLVCTSCSNSVQIENVHAHKVKSPSACRLPTAHSILWPELEHYLLIADASDILVLPPHHRPIPPIPDIPVEEGWVCSYDVNAPCYGEPFASETSRKHHFKSQHPQVPSKERSPHYRTSSVQLLYSFAAHCICIATSAMPPPPTVLRYENFISFFED
ncbi:hypothetical protein BDN71DRAFT_1507558 [Pleurotus eryngii]|uniref:Uncharacterized protein n=1 Tax=Pleurotus eryngii TaxID=5323 RepID=A0A9P5ZWS1_PLEER|nr:hypothetical protein BDN71DRAFT_1507558 [Pleurotus eryngii]